jgi:hypothetical protein
MIWTVSEANFNLGCDKMGCDKLHHDRLEGVSFF